jgi:hypothetical protein
MNECILYSPLSDDSGLGSRNNDVSADLLTVVHY